MQLRRRAVISLGGKNKGKKRERRWLVVTGGRSVNLHFPLLSLSLRAVSRCGGGGKSGGGIHRPPPELWGAHMEMEKKRALKNEHFLTFLKKKREEEGAFV